jgi:hypothetical protein
MSESGSDYNTRLLRSTRNDPSCLGAGNADMARNDNDMDELMGRIEENLSAAETHLGRVQYFEHKELAMTHATLAATLALLGILEAFGRLTDAVKDLKPSD